jgi:hypothetical protein
MEVSVQERARIRMMKERGSSQKAPWWQGIWSNPGGDGDPIPGIFPLYHFLLWIQFTVLLFNICNFMVREYVHIVLSQCSVQSLLSVRVSVILQNGLGNANNGNVFAIAGDWDNSFVCPDDTGARKRAAKTAAAARRWREYSRQGVDRRGMHILLSQSATEDEESEKTAAMKWDLSLLSFKQLSPIWVLFSSSHSGLPFVCR